VADHAVGGVDGLVAKAPGQAAKREPKAGAATPSENSRKGSRLRAGDACLIEVCHVAATIFATERDHLQSRVESLRDGKDMRIELRCAIRLDAISAVTAKPAARGRPKAAARG